MINKNVLPLEILTFFCLKIQASPSPLYDNVQLLPFDPQGWYSNEKKIAELFAKYHPKIVIEVGCWAGASTRHMASLLPSEGIVYAVNHWLGSIEHQPGQHSWSPVLPNIYHLFLSNTIHAKLTDKIFPIRMDSITASKYLSEIRADVIYIDASHDFASVYADLNAWYPLVKGHGILCGDDWGYPDICQAVDKFSQEQRLKVIVSGARFWYLEE